MNFYRRRPLALALSLGIAVSAAAAFLAAPLKLALMALLAAGIPAVILLLRKGSHTRRNSAPRSVAGMGIPAFLSVAGAVMLCMLLSTYAHYDILATRFETLAAKGDVHPLTAVVLDVRYESGYLSVYTVRLQSLDGRGNGTKGLLRADASLELSVGDTLDCDAGFISLNDAYAFYDMTERDMLANGNYFVGEVDGYANLTGRSGGAEVWLAKLRGRLSAAVSLYLGKDAGALSNALLLAERGELDNAFINRSFSRIGASHILSLSGLHLTVLCGLLEFLTRRLGLPKQARSVLSMLFVIFYVLLTGSPYSAVRAGVMLILLQAARLVQLDSDPITALIAAGALILLVNPPAVFDIGLEMSFAATLGVLVMTDGTRRVLKPKLGGFLRKHRFLRPVERLLSGLLASAGAMLFLIPLQWLHFGEVSLMTPVSTLLLTPLCEVLLWLLPVYMLASAAGISLLAARIAWLVELLCGASIGIAEKLAEPKTLISMETPFALPLIIVTLAVILVMMAKNTQSWLWALLPFGISAAVYLSLTGIYTALRADTGIVCFVNDKSNDAATLLSNGSALVADMSDGSSALMRKAVDALSADGVTEIDTLMLTHLHRKHAVSLRSLCQRRLVRRFLLPQPLTAAEEAVAADLLELADESGAAVVFYPRPARALVGFEGFTLAVYETAYLPRSTHPLLGLTLTFGETEIAYIGSSLWEDSAAARFAEASAIVLFGSHGPKLKSEPTLLLAEHSVRYSATAEINGTPLGEGLRIVVKP